MVEAARQKADLHGRLRAVLLESLPLDDVRLEEWRVWLAFWGESMRDPELAAEDARRYAEWTSMLAGVVAPVIEDGSEVEREVEHLVALADGLGLRIARGTKDDFALERDRAAALRVLDGQLSRFRPAATLQP